MRKPSGGSSRSERHPEGDRFLSVSRFPLAISSMQRRSPAPTAAIPPHPSAGQRVWDPPPAPAPASRPLTSRVASRRAVSARPRYEADPRGSRLPRAAIPRDPLPSFDAVRRGRGPNPDSQASTRRARPARRPRTSLDEQGQRTVFLFRRDRANSHERKEQHRRDRIGTECRHDDAVEWAQSLRERRRSATRLGVQAHRGRERVAHERSDA